MNKYWIYVGKNNDQTVDTKYFIGEQTSIPKGMIFVGTCEVEPEFFGGNLTNRFEELFVKYAERHYEKKIKTIFGLK